MEINLCADGILVKKKGGHFSFRHYLGVHFIGIVERFNIVAPDPVEHFRILNRLSDHFQADRHLGVRAARLGIELKGKL